MERETNRRASQRPATNAAPAAAALASAPERTVSLLGLPDGVMGSLLRDLLDAPARLALLATCLPLSKLVVQHLCGDAASEERPFKLVRRVFDEGDSDEKGAAQSGAGAGAAAEQAPLPSFSDALVGLVVGKWARTRLHVQLDGRSTRTYPYINRSTPIAPPPASMLPFITRLDLHTVTLTDGLLLAVQQCVHLRELSVEHCKRSVRSAAPPAALQRQPAQSQAASATSVITTSTTTTNATGATVTTTTTTTITRGASIITATTNTTSALTQSSTPAASSGAPPPQHVWQPLPHLRCLRMHLGFSRSPVDVLALASGVREYVHDGTNDFDASIRSLPNLERVTKVDRACTTDVLALLQHPNVRHVAVDIVELGRDLSQRPCRWETLEVRSAEPTTLLQLPLGDMLRQVVVTERLALGQGLPALVERLGGRLVLRLQPGCDVDAAGWGQHLRQGGTLRAHETFFFLRSWRLQHMADDGLERVTDMVLPKGGGPDVLMLFVNSGDVTAMVACLADALARSRVRTLCIDLKWTDDDPPPSFGALVQVLPSSITHLWVHVNYNEAAQLLVARPPPHPLRLTLHGSRVRVQEQQLRQACAGHQPWLELVLTRA